jgi:hypothetical protein
MVNLNGFEPEVFDYYVAIIQLNEHNFKHKVIIRIDYVNGYKIWFTPFNDSCESYTSTDVWYFELVEKINMD